MSAEQALERDDQLDARSDVYSLGATLYELLTLETPFSHISPHALLAQVSLGRFTPPRQANQAISPSLDAIITKAIAREPDQRQATARHLSDDLETYLNTPTRNSTVTEKRRAKLRRGHMFSALLATVALAILLAVAPWHDSFPVPVYEWNGHYYALTDHEMDWVLAEAEAVACGGHLITVNNAEEQAFVEKTFLSPPDRVFWIGMTDAEKEGDWHWVSGEPVEYRNWQKPGEPNNVTDRHRVNGQVIDEDYGVINWHVVCEQPYHTIGSWNDVSSIPNDERARGYLGIMEFESDPR